MAVAAMRSNFPGETPGGQESGIGQDEGAAAGVVDDLLDVGVSASIGSERKCVGSMPPMMAMGTLELTLDARKLALDAEQLTCLTQGHVARGRGRDRLNAGDAAGLHRRKERAYVAAGMLDVMHAVRLEQRAPWLISGAM